MPDAPIHDARPGESVYSAIMRVRRHVSGVFRVRHNDRVMVVPPGESATDADARFARLRDTLLIIPRDEAPRAGGFITVRQTGDMSASVVVLDRERTVEALAVALSGHRIDTLSQDTAKTCECGSSSQGRPRWDKIDEHRAQIALAALIGPAPEPEPDICPARFIIEPLADPAQDERMKCSLPIPEGADKHRGQHVNASGDLHWQTGAEVSIRAILAAQE